MVAILKEGIAKFPTKAKKMSSSLAKYYLIDGQKNQKADKFEAAKESYTQSSELKSKYQVDAIYSLGNLYYNEGAKVLQEANPIANSNPEQFKLETAKAKKFFNSALVELRKAEALSPAREDIKGQIKAVSQVL